MQQDHPPKPQLATLFAIAALTAVAAQPNDSTNTLNSHIAKALAEKQVDRRMNALAGVANALSLAEIPGALKAADNLKPLRERLAFRDSVLKRWGELAPAEAFAHVSQMPEGLAKVEAVRNVATAYARTNSPAAAAAALKMNPGRARIEAVSLISEIWAGNNAKAALKWANELPDEPLKQTALRSIYFVWVHSDPGAAAATVQNLLPGYTKNALLMNVAEKWAVTDPLAAIKWAQALPVEEEKHLAMATAIESWAESDPRAAYELASNLSPPELRERAVLATLESWSRQDPMQAFDMVVKLADPVLQERGIVRVLNVCGPVCPESACQWVEQLPTDAPTIRDFAIEACVEAVCAWHPEAAARLAVKAHNSAVRERASEKAMSLWLRLDPDSAKRWLAEAELPDETKQRLSCLNPRAEF